MSVVNKSAVAWKLIENLYEKRARTATDQCVLARLTEAFELNSPYSCFFVPCRKFMKRNVHPSSRSSLQDTFDLGDNMIEVADNGLVDVLGRTSAWELEQMLFAEHRAVEWSFVVVVVGLGCDFEGLQKRPPRRHEAGEQDNEAGELLAEPENQDTGLLYAALEARFEQRDSVELLGVAAHRLVSRHHAWAAVCTGEDSGRAACTKRARERCTGPMETFHRSVERWVRSEEETNGGTAVMLL